jgi:polyhydroxybutyrate depolymerase
MKQLFILLLVCFTIPAIAQTRYDVTMTVDSVERQFIVVRPSGTAPAEGYPLVFMFHGTSGDGEKFYNISGWKEKGETEKFITVFPSSLRYCFLDDSTGQPKPTTKWNNGEAQEKKCPGEYLKDDIHFVRMMIDTITKVFPIDRRRIYASGFSNGGVFASKLAVEMSDVFAAISASDGPLNELDSATPARAIPFAFIVGSRDDRFYTPFGIPAIPFNDSCLRYFASFTRRYLGAFNLAETYSRDSTALSLTYLFNTPASTGAASSQFSLTLLKDMTHEYPNGTNYPLTAANFFWTFFSSFTLPASVPDLPGDRHRISVYPNPTSDYLFVDGEGEMTLTLRTILGQPVFTTTATSRRRVDLPPLARGVYLVDIAEGGGHSTKMIVLQ